MPWEAAIRHLGGGTIQVINSDLTTDVYDAINNTTSFINPNGFNATFSAGPSPAQAGSLSRSAAERGIPTT